MNRTGVNEQKTGSTNSVAGAASSVGWIDEKKGVQLFPAQLTTGQAVGGISSFRDTRQPELVSNELIEDFEAEEDLLSLLAEDEAQAGELGSLAEPRQGSRPGRRGPSASSSAQAPANSNVKGDTGSRRSTSPRTGFSKKKVPSVKPAHEFATQTRANALDPAQLDPKRARRIIANRQSAHKSRLKKLNQIHSLEKEVEDIHAQTQALRVEAQTLECSNSELLSSVEASRNLAMKLQVQVQQQVVINQTFRSEFIRMMAVLRERQQQQLQQQGQQGQQEQQGQQGQQQQQQQDAGAHEAAPQAQAAGAAQLGGGSGGGNGTRSGAAPRLGASNGEAAYGMLGSQGLPREALPHIAEEQLLSEPASMATTHNGANLLSQAASYESMQTLSTVTPPGSLPRMDVLPVVSPSGSDTIMDSSPLINMPTLTFPGSDHRISTTSYLGHPNMALVDAMQLGAAGAGADGRQFGVSSDSLIGRLPNSCEGSLQSLMELQQYDMGLPDLNFTHDLFMAMPTLDTLAAHGAGGSSAGVSGTSVSRLAAGLQQYAVAGPTLGPNLNPRLQLSGPARERGSVMPLEPVEQPPGLGSLEMKSGELAAAAAGQELASPMRVGLSLGTSLPDLADLFAKGCLDS